MKIFWKLTLTELRLSSRNIIFLIFSILMPVLLIILFGGIYGNEIDAASRLFPLGAVNTSTPAYIALSLAIITLVGMPSQIVGYKENKVLKRMKATPVKSWQILMPIFINYLLIFLAGMLFLLLIAVIFFDLQFSGNFFAFLLALVLSVTAMFSIGFLLSCFCTNVKQITAIGFSLLIPLVFLSGATMPLSAFPDAMTYVSKAVPLTYCVDFMQNTFLGKPFSDNWLNLGILAGITAVCIALSIKLFKWE